MYDTELVQEILQQILYVPFALEPKSIASSTPV